jgi:hypothetical protein
MIINTAPTDGKNKPTKTCSKSSPCITTPNQAVILLKPAVRIIIIEKRSVDVCINMPPKKGRDDIVTSD